MVPALVPILLLFIFAIPMSVALYPVIHVQSEWAKIIALLIAPVSFVLLFMTCSGLLSKIFQKGIIAGTFPRELSHPIYGIRRLYGLCWTAVYYFTPIYFILLSVPLLKKILFRLFGYNGSTEFTVYPDTWIRDLPLLKIGKGAYLSNRSTIGTNICLKSGGILVEGIEIDQGGLVGHMAMLAPGVCVGEGAEIGVGSGIGIRSRIQKDSKVSPNTTINHGVMVGQNCDIGTMSYIGIRSVIRDQIKIPAGANIPAGSVLNSQKDVESYLNSETQLLIKARERYIDTLTIPVAG